MNDWSDGYTTDETYIASYFTDLAPNHARFTLDFHGIDHAIGSSVTYLELAFGRGISANIHAATNPGTFRGNDFNPAHALEADLLAREADTGLHVSDDSFQDLLARGDLPQFDMIKLYGVWSWISDDNRRIIRDIARHHLKPGGVLYVNYNTLPGWHSLQPYRHLAKLHYDRKKPAGRQSGAHWGDINGFVDDMMAAGGAFFAQNPLFKKKVEIIRKKDRSYLSHEYLNADLAPFYFADVAAYLSAAKLDFAISANLTTNSASFLLNDAQRAMMEKEPDRILRETMMDYFLNMQFRRDYFVRGLRSVGPTERMHRLRGHYLVPIRPLGAKQPGIKTMKGRISVKEDQYAHIRALFDASETPQVSIGHMIDTLQARRIPPNLVLTNILMLVQQGLITPANTPEQQKQVEHSARAFNRTVLERSRRGEDIGHLASPVSGGGVPSGFIEQCFIRQILGDKPDAQGMADHAHRMLQRKNTTIGVDGKPVEGADNIRRELMHRAEAFKTGRLPLLQRLKAF